MTRSTMIKQLENAGSMNPTIDYEILKEYAHTNGVKVSEITAVEGYSDGYTDFGIYALVRYNGGFFKFYVA